MEKLKKLQIKVIDYDSSDDNNILSQSNERTEDISNIQSKSLTTPDFWLNNNVVSNNDDNFTNVELNENNPLAETSSINIHRVFHCIKNIQSELFKYMICNTVLAFIWTLFLCADIYYMVKCPICCEDLYSESSVSSSLGIFSTCLLVFLVSRYGFMTLTMLFLWYKLHKIIQFLFTVKDLVVDLQSEEYFDDTQQMGICIKYFMSLDQAVKNQLKKTSKLEEEGKLESNQYKDSNSIVNLERIDTLHQTFLPFLNLPITTHGGLPAQQPSNNKYIHFISTLDAIPLLTLIIYGFMFIGTQNIHLTHICDQFFTFLCIFLIFLIIFSFFTFITWLVYFLR